MKNHKGQILLITLLVLTVATTIALSLIGRATTDLSISNQLEESTRAFNAAEAGIEQALKSGLGSGGPVTLVPGVSYDVSVNDIGGASGVYLVGHKTPAYSTETLWLAEHSVDGSYIVETPFFTQSTITVCWGRESVPDPAAAIEIGVLYKESLDASYKIARVAWDPQADTRNNNFDSTGITTNGCGLGFYQKTLNFATLGITPSADAIISLQMKPYYTDTTFAIDPGAAEIPKQGNRIQSVGATGTGVSRKVVVYQQYRAPLSVFDSVIYSESGFSH